MSTEARRTRGVNDLEEALFDQIDALRGADCDEKRVAEIDRTNALVRIADRVIASGQFRLASRRAAEEFGWKDDLPLNAAPQMKQLPAATETTH